MTKRFSKIIIVNIDKHMTLFLVAGKVVLIDSIALPQLQIGFLVNPENYSEM